MTEFDGERVRGGYLIRGYASAYERFQHAQASGDPEGTFHALFEALNWAVAIDDYIARVWSPRGKVEGYDWRSDPALPGSLVPVMAGLRYARARVHHQWADAIYAQPGAMLPFTLPRVLMTWAWRPVEELPTPSAGHDDKRGHAAYEEVLAGCPVEVALGALRHALDFLGSLLDPPIPRRTAPVVEVVSE